MPKERGNSLSRVYYRLPITNSLGKPVVEGHSIYIPNIDPEKVDRVRDFVEKTSVKDVGSHWRSFKGYDGLKGARTFTDEELDNLLSEQLQQVYNSYPSLENHPILSELVKTIYDLKAVIMSAENRDSNDVARSLQSHTYSVLSALSDVVLLVAEVQEKESLTQSLLSSYEHLDEQDAKLWMVCGQTVQNYHQKINSLLEFENDISNDILSLAQEVNGMVSRKLGVLVQEEELSPLMTTFILTDFKGADSASLREQVSSLLNEIQNFNQDCDVYLRLVQDLKTRLAAYPAMVKEAKKAFESFATYRQQEDISALFLQKWVTEEVYKEAMEWMEQGMHKSSAWDSKMLALQGELSNKQELLQSLNSSKVAGWLTVIPETAPTRSSVPIPTILPGFSHSLASTAPTLAPPQPEASYPLAKPKIVKKEGSKTYTQKRDYERYTTKLPELHVNPELPVPGSLDDLMELFELVAASREANRNPLRGATLKSAWDVLQMAGFDLSRHGLNELREYFPTCPYVEKVPEGVDPKERYEESGKHMLIYKVATGTPASKIRYKLAKRRYDHQTSLTALEKKWDISRASLQFLSKERRDMNDSKGK